MSLCLQPVLHDITYGFGLLHRRGVNASLQEIMRRHGDGIAARLCGDLYLGDAVGFSLARQGEGLGRVLINAQMSALAS